MSTASGSTPQARPTPQPAQKTPMIATAPAKIPLPKKFTGERSKLRSFLTSMELYLRYNEQTFPMPQDKIMSAGMNLDGEALDWFQPYMQDFMDYSTQPAKLRDDTRRIFSNYQAFEKEIKIVFGVVDEQRTAAIKLRQLRQVGAASEYTTKFRQISSRLDWDDDPLMNQYYIGLKDSVKDEVVRQDWPEDMDAMIKLATRIDTRLYERKMEKQRSGFGVQRTRKTQRDASPGDPMELDRIQDDKRKPNARKKTQDAGRRRGTMSPEQRKRFAAGACLQCGEKGHYARDCGKAQVRMIRSQRDPLGEHRDRLISKRCWVCGSDQHFGNECAEIYWRVGQDLGIHLETTEGHALMKKAADEQFRLPQKETYRFVTNTLLGREEFPIKWPPVQRTREERIKELQEGEEKIQQWLSRCQTCGSKEHRGIPCEELQETLDQDSGEETMSETPPPTLWNDAEDVIHRITVGTCWICGSDRHVGTGCFYDEHDVRLSGYTEVCQIAGRMIKRFQNNEKTINWKFAPNWTVEDRELVPHHEDTWYNCIHSNCEYHEPMKEIYDPEEGRASVFQEPDPEGSKNW